MLPAALNILLSIPEKTQLGKQELSLKTQLFSTNQRYAFPKLLRAKVFEQNFLRFAVASSEAKAS